MAAACLDSEETEDLVTCSICCCEYDDDLRKPKFLDCFHTFCIQCMQVFCHLIKCQIDKINKFKLTNKVLHLLGAARHYIILHPMPTVSGSDHKRN